MKKTISLFQPYQKKSDKIGIPTSFNKSSKKFEVYETLPKPKQDIEHSTLYTTSSAAFLDNVKKIPNKFSQFRQTINYKTSNQEDFVQEQIKPKTNKTVNILRQTINMKPVFKSRPDKTVSQSFSEFSANSTHDSHPKTESNIVISNSRKVRTTITESKSHQSLHYLKEQEKMMREELSKATQKAQKWKNNSKQFWRIPEKQQLKATQPHKLMETGRLEQALQQLENLKISSANVLNSPRRIHESKILNQELVFRKKKKEQKPIEIYSPQLPKVCYQERFKEGISTPSTQYSGDRSPASQFFQVVDPRKKLTKFGIGEFNIEKNLGQGKFGLVMRVKHKDTGAIFALKKIPKDMIRSHFMIDQLVLEIKIQTYLHHKNILGVHGIFDDRTHLYLILDYMEQGTLYSQLKKQKILPERQAKIIVKQITEAVEYLHANDIAHRDIKPENIVISHNVCKLCDFGWATICNERRKTYCGTLDYSAPQILEGKEYDMSVDLWCLGVMAYELLTGKAPFYHVSRKETVKKILNVETQCIVYPKSMSPEAVDFIQNLVRKDPNERMSAHDALKHRFLQTAEDQ